MQEKPKVAIIGGSGLYQMAGLEDISFENVQTPFGKPSAPITVGTLDGFRIAFLARHGIGHWISPTEINNQANIYALKALGVEKIISISACGSLREDFAPGHIIIPDQLVDFTNRRKRSFFGEGMVVHISSANPFCQDLSTKVAQAINTTGAISHIGSTFITIEGPRFSTKAESNLFRSWGMSIIGMTASPEAFLAREAEMCYAVMAHVTDYDVWHQTEDEVSVEMVVRTLQKNTEIAQNSIHALLPLLTTPSQCECQTALKNAVITQVDKIPTETRQKLDLLVGKYLK